MTPGRVKARNKNMGLTDNYPAEYSASLTRE